MYISWSHLTPTSSLHCILLSCSVYGCWLASAFDIGSSIECILFHGFLQRQKPTIGLIYVRLSWRFGELEGVYIAREIGIPGVNSPLATFSVPSFSLLSHAFSPSREHSPYHCPPTSPIFPCKAFGFSPFLPSTAGPDGCLSSFKYFTEALTFLVQQCLENVHPCPQTLWRKGWVLITRTELRSHLIRRPFIRVKTEDLLSICCTNFVLLFRIFVSVPHNLFFH